MVILIAVLLVPLLLVAQVDSIAYFPNGTRMVVVEGKKVHVLDAATGKECFCINFDDEVIAHAA